MKPATNASTISIASLLLLAAACGGGGGAGPIDQATAEDVCQQVCDRDVECGDPADPMCVADCADGLAGVIREDVIEDALACTLAAECDAVDDCELECSPTSTHTAYEAHCREALGACDISTEALDGICEVNYGPGPDGDQVGSLCLFATPIIDDLDACMDEPDCNAIAACIQAVSDGLDL